MRKLLLHRLFLMFLFLALGYAEAQDTVEVVPALADTLSFGEDTADDYDYDNGVLYFSGKEDTTALYDSSFVLWRSVPDSLIQQLKHEDSFWYVDKDLQKKKREEKKNSSWWQDFLETIFEILSNPIVRQILFYCIIFLFVAAATWFLINNQMNIFGKSKGRLKPIRETTSAEEDILNRDLDKMLREAEQAKDYRLAVRVRYLLLLKTLSEGQLIQYRDDATNLEYLTQVYGKSFYQPFFALTRHYEYVWYGEAGVTESIYQRLATDFDSLHQTLLTA